MSLATIKKTTITIAALVVSIALALTLIPLSTASAETAAQKQAEARAALRTLNDLQEELDAVSDVYFGALNAKEAAENQIKESEARIEEANKEIAGLQEKISVRAVAMYKTGSGSFLDIIFGVQTFEDFISTWDFLTQMNASDAELISQTKTLREEIETQKVQYQNAVKEAEEQALSVEDAYTKAASLESAARSTYNALNNEAKALLAAEQEAEAARYREQVAQQVKNQSSSGTYQNYNIDLGNSIVALAYSRLGCEYIWAASGPNSFDCSGLVSWCYGYSYHRFTSNTLYTLPAVSNPQPGDVVVSQGHAAIYVGDGTIIHAKDYGYGVVVDSLSCFNRLGNWKIVRPSHA